jgi:hypothetical protein
VGSDDGENKLNHGQIHAGVFALGAELGAFFKNVIMFEFFAILSGIVANFGADIGQIIFHGGVLANKMSGDLGQIRAVGQHLDKFKMP